MALGLTGTVSAQTVKSISVSGQDPYTDHLTLSEDSRDKDLMVKFTFDEAANTLTVSLVSYRSMFVCWDNVLYKTAFKGRNLKPEKLPYVVESDPSQHISVTKLFKSSLPRPLKTFAFSRWIEYNGLQAVSTPHKLVNDVIEQQFDIQGKREVVCVTLRDILFMDKRYAKPTKGDQYEISFGRDLYLQYQILIKRDPCFGMEDDIQAAENARDAAKKASYAITKRFGSGKVSNEESLKIFKETKALFLEQYPFKQVSSTCSTLIQTWNDYNGFVNAITALDCELVAYAEDDGVFLGPGVDEGLLLSKARQIDNAVSRLLLTDDKVEQRDIRLLCDKIIAETDALVKEQGVHTEQQRNALSIFRQAEKYYKKISGVK